jgi:hypothetical protein
MSGASRILVGAEGIVRVSLALERSGEAATGLPDILRAANGDLGSSHGAASEKFKTRGPDLPVGDLGSFDDLLVGVPKFSPWDESADGFGDVGEDKRALLRASLKSAFELFTYGPAAASTFSCWPLSERKNA